MKKFTRTGLITMAAFALLRAVIARGQAPDSSGNPQPAPTVKRAIEWKRFDYTCENGSKLTVYLHNETIKVRYQDQIYLMKQTRSADGGRYSDGKVVWWSKGDGGFLQNDTPDGDGTMIVKDCKLDRPLNSSAVRTDTVTGTVSYMSRIALPPSSVIDVRLGDVSVADAAARLIAEDKITMGDRQIPVPFTLKFDPAGIDPVHTYSVSARILVDGQMRFTSDTAHPVLTQGNSDHVEILVKPVPAAATPQP